LLSIFGENDDFSQIYQIVDISCKKSLPVKYMETWISQL